MEGNEEEEEEEDSGPSAGFGLGPRAGFEEVVAEIGGLEAGTTVPSQLPPRHTLVRRPILSPSLARPSPSTIHRQNLAIGPIELHQEGLLRP